MSFNRLLQSKISSRFYSSRRSDLNLDSDFEFGFNFYQKLVELYWKLVDLHRKHHIFQYKLSVSIEIIVFDYIIDIWSIKIDLLIENISKNINFKRKYIKFDRIYIEIEIADSDSSLESESDRKRQSNLDRDFWFDDDDSIRYP